MNACLSDAQVQALANLACHTRPRGSARWDPPGVVAGIRRLMDRGFSAQEVIDRVFAHAWDAEAKTPGTLLTPKSRKPVETNPTPFPVTRGEECRLHPGESVPTCRPCAADRLMGDSTPLPRADPPAYDDEGHRLRHTPLRDLYDQTRAELATTEESQ